METKNSDFYITKGSDFRAVVNVVGADGERLDISQMDFYCHCVYTGEELHHMDVKVKKLDEKNGIVELFVPRFVTNELPDGDWNYQLSMFYRVDETDCIPLEGRIVLKKDRYERF